MVKYTGRFKASTSIQIGYKITAFMLTLVVGLVDFMRLQVVGLMGFMLSWEGGFAITASTLLRVTGLESFIPLSHKAGLMGSMRQLEDGYLVFLQQSQGGLMGFM